MPTKNLSEIEAGAKEVLAAYLGIALRHIDEMLGEGYAREHPELLGAMVQAIVAEYHAGVMTHIAEAISDLGDSLSRDIYELKEILESRK